jgi:hypothetical protein
MDAWPRHRVLRRQVQKLRLGRIQGRPGSGKNGAAGRLCHGCKGASLSLFFSGIDVGAITAFRFDGGAGTVPEMEWRNIIAPGGHLIIGFPRGPFSFGIGGQLSPMLRKISAPENPDSGPMQVLDKSEWRINLAFAVDIPLFDFYTSPKF